MQTVLGGGRLGGLLPRGADRGHLDAGHGAPCGEMREGAPGGADDAGQSELPLERPSGRTASSPLRGHQVLWPPGPQLPVIPADRHIPASCTSTCTVHGRGSVYGGSSLAAQDFPAHPFAAQSNPVRLLERLPDAKCVSNRPQVGSNPGMKMGLWVKEWEFITAGQAMGRFGAKFDASVQHEEAK